MSETIALPFEDIETIHLAGLLDEFSALLRSSRDTADPAVSRLTPDAYPDDREASTEFATSTRDDLLDRRLADIEVVRDALAPFLPAAGDDAAESAHTISVPRRDLGSWLRTFAALRLVLASRLGIDKVDRHDQDDPRFGVYDWLAYRLDGLVALAQDPD